MSSLPAQADTRDAFYVSGRPLHCARSTRRAEEEFSWSMRILGSRRRATEAHRRSRATPKRPPCLKPPSLKPRSPAGIDPAHANHEQPAADAAATAKRAPARRGAGQAPGRKALVGRSAPESGRRSGAPPRDFSGAGRRTGDDRSEPTCRGGGCCGGQGACTKPSGAGRQRGRNRGQDPRAGDCRRHAEVGKPDRARPRPLAALTPCSPRRTRFVP